MLEGWFNDPSRVGATVLLLAAVFSFWKGLVVPRWIFDKAVSDCAEYKARNDRLLDQLERQVSVAEISATTAARVARKI